MEVRFVGQRYKLKVDDVSQRYKSRVKVGDIG